MIVDSVEFPTVLLIRVRVRVLLWLPATFKNFQQHPSMLFLWAISSDEIWTKMASLRMSPHQLVSSKDARCLCLLQKTFLFFQKDRGLCFQSLGQAHTWPPLLPNLCFSPTPPLHQTGLSWLRSTSLAACERKFPISNFACEKICMFLRGPFVWGHNGSNWSAEVIKCSVSSTLRRHARDFL